MKINMMMVRYLVVAVLAYVVDLGGFALLVQQGMHPAPANIVVKIVAALFGFFMHRRFTYQFSGKEGMGAHAVKYFGLAAVYTPASTLVLYGLLFFMSSVVNAKIVADVVLFVATYAITTSLVFTAKAKSPVAAERSERP